MLRAGQQDVATRVSPRKMLQHVDRLRAGGLSANQIAQRAGITASTISRARHSSGAQVSRIVEQAVLSVQI